MPSFDPTMKMPWHAPSRMVHGAPAPSVAVASSASPSAPTGGAEGGYSLDSAFHDLLDIVNPLQHLPVVGTIYRALTGDTIGTIEKIAGGALYGGVAGAISSVADTAFEAITGKNFGDTVLAFFLGGQEDKVQVAANTPAKPAIAQSAPQMSAADIAFTSALGAKGLNGELSSRAMYAYRKSQGLPEAVLARAN